MAESSSEDNHSKSVASTSLSSSSEDQLSRESEAKKSIIQRIRGSFSIIGHLFYRTSKDDFEKKLQHLSKEEAAAHTRLKRRSQAWRKLARGVIIYSVIIELLILGIAVVTTRALELTWQMRALRVLPVFAFPAFASLVYSTCASYYRMCERKDQKALERLRNERQAKINELKERTNYYLTQQLIHKYDSDPAAKEAAARVLASKLGAEAGLSLTFESSTIDEANKLGLAERRSKSVEASDATGLRRRVKQQDSPSASQPLPPPSQQLITTERMELGEQAMEMDQFTGKLTGGGWVARLAAMLVGEDPTQCYALICRNCHMHNGLARKEDFQYITYYCPHCQSLNGSRQLGETGEGNGLQAATSLDARSALQVASNLALADALLTGEGSDSDHLTSSLQESSADSRTRQV